MPTTLRVTLPKELALLSPSEDQSRARAASESRRLAHLSRKVRLMESEQVELPPDPTEAKAAATEVRRTERSQNTTRQTIINRQHQARERLVHIRDSQAQRAQEVRRLMEERFHSAGHRSARRLPVVRSASTSSLGTDSRPRTTGSVTAHICTMETWTPQGSLTGC